MKNLLLPALAGLMLCGCTLEPPEIPAEELYLREFIKSFGLIDPNQKWNTAMSADVTFIPAGHADFVRVKAISQGRHYTVAEITDVNHSITIPLDIVNDVESLKVEIDGDTYYTTPGGRVDASLPKSRTFVDAADKGRITVTDAVETVELDVSTVFKIFDVLPEGGPIQGVQAFPGNLNAPDIQTDFLLNSGPEGKEITVFPVYWNTCQTHELGIYYFDTDNVTQESAATLKRVPFYEMRHSPEFENVVYAHSSTGGGNYEYRKYKAEAASTAALSGTEKFDGGALYETVSIPPATVENSAQENILFCGNADYGIGSNQYGWWNACAYKLLAGQEEERCGTGWSTYQNYWKVELTDDDAVDGGWSHQFRVHVSRGLVPGETVTLKFKNRATHAITNNCRVYIDASSAPAGHNTVCDIGTVQYTTDWVQHEFTFKIPATEQSGLYFPESGHLPDCIVFWINYKYDDEEDANVKHTANTYMFDDIELLANPYEPIYKISGWRTPNTYRPANSTSWEVTTTYRDKDNNNVSYLTETKIMTGSSISDAHLLVRTADGLCFPLSQVPNVRNESYKNDGTAQKVVSKGIKLTVPANKRYGFYIHFTDMMSPYNEKYVYSEVKGNIEFLTQTKNWASYDENNYDDRRKTTYCAMFDQMVGNTKYTYLTFEDWTPGSNDSGNRAVGDYDLNDLAFLVMGVNLEEEIEKERNFDFILCAEDLGVTDDFDFNDMIVGVKSITAGTGDDMYKKVTFTALAAGGTLPLYLHYSDGINDQILTPEGSTDGEWHSWFGVTNVTQMINTINDKPYISGKSVTLDMPSTFNLANFGRVSNGTIGGIYITVNSPEGETDVINPGRTILAPHPGNAPQMFIIQDIGYLDGSDTRSWQWPAERAGIDDVYKTFTNWAAGNGSTNADWYQQQPKGDYYRKRPQ